MMVMIDPNNVRGALTGGQTAQQADQAQSQQPASPATQTPAQNVANTSDALTALENLVAESAQIPTSQTQDVPAVSQPVQPNQVLPPTQPELQTQPAPPQPSPVQSVPQQQVPATQPQSLQPQASQIPDQQATQVQADDSSVNAQAVLNTIQSSPDPLNPPNPAPASAKEVFERPAAPDATSVDVGGAIQQVEVEKNPELPTEVEGFLERVEDFSAKPPQEVVIADGTNEQASTNYPSRPVIILPITEEEEKKGKKKSPRNSIRWLVEWSHKIVKMFAGKVIYRHVEEK